MGDLDAIPVVTVVKPKGASPTINSVENGPIAVVCAGVARYAVVV